MSGFGLKFPSAPRRQPMSNTERQRRFRERHPGYYARLKATRRAALSGAAKRQNMAALPASTAIDPRPAKPEVTIDDVPIEACYI